MRGLPSISLLFLTKFNKFNNIRAYSVLDCIVLHKSTYYRILPYIRDDVMVIIA